MLIQLTRDKYAIIDDEDFNVISRYKWQCRKDGYAVTCKGLRMHRLIMGLDDKDLFDVDHINGDSLDNRKDNLRLCNAQQNLANSKIRKSNKSGYKGVYFVRSRNKWAAQIKFNYKSHYIGYFDDILDAAKAYDDKAKELFGEFARTNERIYKGD